MLGYNNHERRIEEPRLQSIPITVSYMFGHGSDITRASRRLKSSAIWPFVQQIVHPKNKDNSLLALCVADLTDFPHKWQATWTEFSCRHVYTYKLHTNKKRHHVNEFQAQIDHRVVISASAILAAVMGERYPCRPYNSTRPVFTCTVEYIKSLAFHHTFHLKPFPAWSH